MTQGRRAFKLAAVGLAGLLLLLPILAFVAVQTPPGRSLLAAVLGRVLADSDERVTITGLAGFVPFDMTAERIDIADVRGSRLVVTQAAVSMKPADLFMGRLALRRLMIGEIDVIRPAEGGEHTNVLALLRPPLAIRLEEGHIERLVLGAAFTGEAAVATLSAHGTLGGSETAIDLDLHRIDSTPGNARIHFALSGTPPRLTLESDIEEPSGRLLGGLSDQGQKLPLALHLTGQGLLSDWHGSLAAHAGPVTALDAEFAIADQRFVTSGHARFTDLLPSALRKLLGASATFSGAFTLAGSDVRLEALRLATSDATLTAGGHFERATQTLAGEAKIELADLSDIAPLLGKESGGAASAALTVGGALHNLAARLTLAGERLMLDRNRIGTAHATIDLRLSGDALDAASPIDVSASGDASGIALAAASVPSGLGDRLDWRLAGRLDRMLRRIELRDLTASDAGITIEAQAAGSSGDIAGEAILSAPDIAAFAGAERHGAARLAADFHAGADGAAIAVLHGTVREARSGVAALDRLLGAETGVAATLQRSLDGTLSASEVSIDGTGVMLTGEARRAADGRLDAEYKLALPRLAALAPEIAGSAVITGKASGLAQALSASATLHAEALSAGAAQLDRVEAQVEAPDLGRRLLRIDAKFRGAGLDGTASAEARLDAETLHLDRLRLAAAGTKLDGDLGLRLKPLALDGTLRASLPDLKPWSALAGTPLAGNGTVDARFAAGKGQTLELRLEGRALHFGEASLQRAQATVSLADLLTQPSGHAELRAEAAALGPASLTNLRLDGELGRSQRLSLRGDAQGRIGEAFTLDLSAEGRRDERGIELRLTRLAGTLGKQPLRLHQPLLLTQRGATLGFADLDFGLGSGQIAGAGSLTATTLALHLQAKTLPVHSLAALAGQPEVSGVVGFEATVGGSRTQPEGTLVVDAEELRLAAANQPDLPPVGFVVSAQWRRSDVQFQGRVTGPQKMALGFNGGVPLALDPRSLAMHLPPQGALTLHLEGSGELANLADLLPLGEDRFAGRISVDVSVGGTVAAPTASGQLTLRDGRYESLFWGTALQSVNFDLVGDRDRLVLRNFHASDGAKGSLALSGSVDLAVANGPAFDIVGKFESFRAMQRDEATGTVSGEVSLGGNLAAPRLGGKLRIEQAELRVPERLPQTLQPIAVTITDSATGKVLATPEQNRPNVALLSFALAVDVDMPGQVFVRGRGLDSEWRGNLSIAGTTAQPAITGTLDVVRGTYDFLGKSAVLNRGTIRFQGGKRIDPDIDIEAQASSTDVVAIIDITGTATQPTIKLSSQPALPQDDILARVLFGTSISQVTAAQGIEIAQAAATLATGGGPGVFDRVRQTLGLDRLNFGSTTASPTLGGVTMPSTPAGVPSAFPTAGLGSAPVPVGAAAGTGALSTGAVSAGKYVGNGIYVGVTQGIDASSSSVDVQIDVTRHISIDTTAGQNTGTGVGVNWKLDY